MVCTFHPHCCVPRNFGVYPGTEEINCLYDGKAARNTHIKAASKYANIQRSIMELHIFLGLGTSQFKI